MTGDAAPHEESNLPFFRLPACAGGLHPGSEQRVRGAKWAGAIALDAEPVARILSVSVGGQLLGPAATYTLCTNDFIAAGGDL